MTDDPKAVQLFQEVLEKTQSDKIRWEPTAKEDRFVAAFGGKFSLVIENDEGRVALELHDQKGRRMIRVDRESDRWVDENLDRLYELARRRALNADAAVDSALESLRSL